VKRAPSIWGIALAFLLAGAWPAQADVHKCRDASGHAAYQDAPCAGAASAPQAAAAAKHIFWQATSGGRTVYLFGSLHVGRPEMYPLPAEVMSAFRQSARLAVEVNMLDVDSVEMMQEVAALGMYPPDDEGLHAHISAAHWQALQRSAAQLDFPIAVLERQKPWMVIMTLTALAAQHWGYDENLGIDMHLMQRAREQGKPIVSLESLDQQLRIFTQMSDEEQEAALAESLDEFDRGPELFERMVTAWRKGDAPGLAAVLAEMEQDPKDDRTYQLLITDRNHGMADKIQALSRDNPVLFVVVGAGHLVGQESVIDLLRKRGYRIRQM